LGKVERSSATDDIGKKKIHPWKNFQATNEQKKKKKSGVQGGRAVFFKKKKKEKKENPRWQSQKQHGVDPFIPKKQKPILESKGWFSTPKKKKSEKGDAPDSVWGKSRVLGVPRDLKRNHKEKTVTSTLRKKRRGGSRGQR